MGMHSTTPDPGPVEELVAAVKPRLRGWLHAGTFPVALVAGLVLTVLAPEGRARIGALVFTVTAALLFGTSAVYHRGTWSARVHGVLKRLDHSNIFLIIAGSYTPFALTLLPADQARSLLLIVWLGAIGGVLFRVFWVGAPRWLYTPIYVALGWVAVFYFGPLSSRSSPREACSTRSALSSTPRSVPTRHRAGSASTRSSTPSRWRRSSRTTSRRHWPSTAPPPRLRAEAASPPAG